MSILRPWFASRWHAVWSSLFLLVLLASWWQPIWPYEQALHNSLTLVGLLWLTWLQRRFPLSATELCGILLFLMLHSVAARWLYSNVPYLQWWQMLTGSALPDMLGGQRNHFDRLVHFMYGACLTPALSRVLSAGRQQVSRQGFWRAVQLIVVSSVAYEWFEWLIAISLSPHDAEAYNGQQGDMWDAHKDMLLATLGSLLWGLRYARAPRESGAVTPS